MGKAIRQAAPAPPERPSLEVLAGGEGRGEHTDIAEVSRCTADWRRPGEYWACAKRSGHRGRHKMRPATQPGP